MYELTIGESEVGRALYKSKNSCRVAKFKNAKGKKNRIIIRQAQYTVVLEIKGFTKLENKTTAMVIIML